MDFVPAQKILLNIGEFDLNDLNNKSLTHKIPVGLQSVKNNTLESVQAHSSNFLFKRSVSFLASAAIESA